MAAMAAMLWIRPLHADGLEGRFEVRSADLQLKDGVYHLNAHMDLPVSDAVRRGLAEGVPLTVELDLNIERVRQLLPNSKVADLTQRYHLQYNAVSARYVLRNDNSGQQESLSTVDAAIEQLSEVRGLPVLDRALIAADRRYEANVRAKVRLRLGAVQPARGDVLGERLASRKRLVHMDIAAVIRKYGSTVLGLIGVALWLVALYLLASAAQNSAEFDEWLPWILLVNISGLVTLVILLAGKLARLVRTTAGMCRGRVSRDARWRYSAPWRSRRFWWSIIFRCNSSIAASTAGSSWK